MDPFIGEIRMFTGNFAPRLWAFCDGQYVTPQQHSSLFALIGATYGGDGYTKSALPDLRGRLPAHYGQGPGTDYYIQGMTPGYERIPLSISQLPSHRHSVSASGDPANESAITANSNESVALTDSRTLIYTEDKSSMKTMDSDTVQVTGNSLPHNNMMPYTVVNFIIALEGEWPSRT
ncbi:MAG: phage tail protein [Magnetococcales bacterium]|nr:phage tail protein [Magnetococcales bacterium]